MHNVAVRSLLVAASALGLLLTGTQVLVAGPDDAPEATVQNVIKAVQDRSYEAFVRDADDKVKAALTKPMFDGVAGQLSPRLNKGFKRTYLTKLRKEGHVVHLWKLTFDDGKDDALVRMAMKDGKVAGIFFQ